MKEATPRCKVGLAGGTTHKPKRLVGKTSDRKDHYVFNYIPGYAFVNAEIQRKQLLKHEEIESHMLEYAPHMR
jgi:hypothetical protein